MKTKLALLFASFLIFSAAALAQGGGGQQHGRGNSNPQHNPPPAQQHNPPRANQGHVPPAPPPRGNRGEQRQPERYPTGHTNDTPHVNNNTWYGHEAPSDNRFHLDQPYAHGRFTRSGASFRYSVTRIDRDRHTFWFPGGFYFQIADWDWPLAADWCWNCGDDFAVYEDPDHPGWYLVYNVHTGVYIHAQYMGG
jgi:hypothetical protein